MSLKTFEYLAYLQLEHKFPWSQSYVRMLFSGDKSED